MAGYQFIHTESYARVAGKGKAGGHSISSVMAEAMRVEGACPHVENPQAPVLLYGVQPQEIEAIATTWADQAKDAQGRKLRKDGLCLLAGTVSCPPEFSDAQWEALKLDAVAYLLQDKRVISIIEHVDEDKRHFHFYAVPLPGERFEDLCVGRKAASQAKAQGGLKGAQNRAYKLAMRGYQDRYIEEVGAKHGMARLGPKKRRLTRVGWVEEQATMEAMAKERQRLTEMQGKLEADLQALELEKAKVREMARAALEEADRIQAQREKNKVALDAIAAKEEAAKEALETSKKAAEKNRKAVVSIKKDRAILEAEKAKIEAQKRMGALVGSFVGQLGKAAALPLVMAVEYVRSSMARSELERLTKKNASLTQELGQEREKIEASEREKERAQRTLELTEARHKKAMQEAEKKAAILEAKIASLTAKKGPVLGGNLGPNP